MVLKDLKTGEEARVVEILGKSAIHRRIMDIGILPGAKLTIVKRAPFGGDPIQVNILNCDLIIRNSEAENIVVTTEEQQNEKTEKRHEDNKNNNG